jgi:VWFA-related protein
MRRVPTEVPMRVPGLLLSFVAVLAVLVVCAAPSAAQTTERTIFVSVVDGKGAPVPDLGPSDFVVREDGSAREILRAMPATQPVDVALLIDNSQSITPHQNDLRNAVKSFAARMAKDGNALAIVGLADRPTIIQEFTNNAALLERATGRIFAQPGSGTTVLDAITDISRGLQKRESLRRAIVVVTTLGTDFSNRNDVRTLEALNDGGAALYALVIGHGDSAALTTEEGRNRAIVLDRGTSSSGGRYETLISSMALAGALEGVADELEHQYQVVYGRPGSLIPPKKIEVSVSRPGLTARGTPAAEPDRPSSGD